MLCFLILYFDFFYICLLQGVLDHSIRRSKTTYQAMSPNDLKKIAEVYKKGQEMMREIGVIIKTRNFCFLYFCFCVKILFTFSIYFCRFLLLV